jgi:transcriptional regulator with XRE-family HTH domain
MDISDYRSSIGKKVRQERLKHGWTQEELAEKIELHPSFIGQIERGIKAASFDTLKRLSLVFGVNSAEFLNEGDVKDPGGESQSVERKITNLLKGHTVHEQEAVYKTIKYILRQKRKLGK